MSDKPQTPTSDFLKAAQAVRIGLPTNYAPLSEAERETLDYLQNSFLLYVGRGSGSGPSTKGEKWKHPLVADLARASRARFDRDVAPALREFEDRRVLDRARAEPGPASIWLVEALNFDAILSFRLNLYERSERGFSELLPICAAIGEASRQSDALTNLAHVAILRGRPTQAQSAAREARERAQADPDAFETLRLETETHLALALDDRAMAARLMGELDGSTAARTLTGWKAFPYRNLCAAFLRSGDLAAAAAAKERLRLCFSMNKNQVLPELLREVNIRMADRLFDPTAAREVADEEVSLACGRERFTLLALKAGGLARAEDSVAIEDLRKWAAATQAALDEGPWAASIETELFAAQTLLALRLDAALEPEAQIGRRLRSLDSSGHAIDAGKLLLLRAEASAAKGDPAKAEQALSAWERHCQRESLEFDRRIAAEMLAWISAKTSPEEAPADEQAARHPAVLAARHLRQSWPWRTIAASRQAARSGQRPVVSLDSSPSPARPVSALEPKLKAERLLAATEAAGGAFVSLETLARELWNEEYDPFLHPHRLHQLAREARLRLKAKGLDGRSLANAYGEGYAFRPIPFGAKLGGEERDVRERLLGLLRSEGAIDASRAAEALEISQRHALRLLQKLVDEGTAASEIQAGRRKFSLALRAASDR